MPELPLPESSDRQVVERWVGEHLGHLICDAVQGSDRFRGGQRAADAALAAYDVTGYAGRRNQVLPEHRRGASALSPWIRHGLLPLRTVWDRVGDGPAKDRRKFRDELLWQEFARHWYARLGRRTRRGVRQTIPGTEGGDGWSREMRCVAACLDELEGDGWLVNQTRMWMASHWTVREGAAWREGEDRFFTHLLDGSRAANRLGWQWTTGVGSNKAYGFSRWQVRKRAPELCEQCRLRDDCPIEGWPDDPSFAPVDHPVELRGTGEDRLTSIAGPTEAVHRDDPAAVWLTAESLGDTDPALAAHPDLPAVFVFDEPLLAGLQLSSKRLVFLAETLTELAEHRAVELRLGDPVEELAQRRLAVTFAPVPGFRDRSGRIDVAELHPWPWLRRPTTGTVQSFSAWRRAVSAP